MTTERPDAGWSVRSPGRVNLIGEHTDYNDGFVLPAAIDLELRLTVIPSGDRRVGVTLASSAETASFDLDDIGSPGHGWIDYVAGVANVLQAAGHRLTGVRAVLESRLPMAAGLSSSAALELAAAWMLLGPGGPEAAGIDRLALARLCQGAENDYVGVSCGLMDQFAVSCGEAGAALLLDCRSLAWRPVVLPLDELALVVIDSGSRRTVRTSEYNERRRRCERGVAILAGRGLPVTSLRDVTVADLEAAADALGDETLRRCRHVVEENGRVLEVVRALEAGDVAALGALFAASHASLRDLYEVSSPALDALVDIATRTPGVVAARMTGAGFGGCTVNLVERDAVVRLETAVSDRYQPLTGLEAHVLRVEPADGVGWAVD